MQRYLLLKSLWAKRYLESFLLIHEVDPQSLPAVVITIFARVVCPSLLPSVPTFQNLAKQSPSENSDR